MSTVPEQTRKANRLIDEGSPYLRQHAYNPVDWYAWGEEAFEKAKAENKPIFLSVGYSTCHWCHVMERESFEDEGVAELLNANFVPVKVDRERRPDVDETYMLATQLVTGHGGWPNSVFLTPDRKPFYAGTYFPIDAFRALLNQVTEYWATKTSALEEDADRLAATIDSIMTRRLEAAEVTPEVLNGAAADLLRSFDTVHGGFGGAPKFPQESILLFLLRLAEKDGHEQALKAVTFSLDAMLRGGIQDQAGGGFHRYAVDQRWLVPHFEKMLYNQALIVQALVRAYRLTGARRYAGAVRRALDYVLDDLTAPGGGFYSARDADSDGKEGAFYVWTPDQLSDALGAEEASFAAKVFGVTPEGNFEDGTTVLHMPRSDAELAAELETDETALAARVDAIRAKLAEARASRPMPERDEKIIAAWNGMMIAAFAEAAEALGEKRYEAAALEAGVFLWEHMHGDDGLKRTFFEGQASLEGQQEDYAFAANGFIALHDLVRDTVWLERAETLIGRMVTDFRDGQAGDYYMSASSTTFGKAKARTDGGTPSGNSAALEAFARLSRRTRTPDHRDNGDALLAALSGLAASSPSACAYTLMAADMQQRGDAGARQFMAQGVVDAEAAYDAAGGALTVRLRIAEGWHVNADKPLEEAFVPTELSVEGAEAATVRYPEAVRRTLGFHGKELALYEGDVTITAQLPGVQTNRLAVRLRLQACSDELCLEPETAILTVPVLRG